MAMSGGKDDGQPMMEMNTTPLIDVMLVLLIMLMITIPPVSHAVNIDLPVQDALLDERRVHAARTEEAANSHQDEEA